MKKKLMGLLIIGIIATSSIGVYAKSPVPNTLDIQKLESVQRQNEYGIVIKADYLYNEPNQHHSPDKVPVGMVVLYSDKDILMSDGRYWDYLSFIDEYGNWYTGWMLSSSTIDYQP